MKDIKSLYLAAKSSKDPKSISEYNECVKEYMENIPSAYILESEYIIKSSDGLKTLKPFIETYGLPIAAYNKIVECLNECALKCENLGLTESLSKYNEAIDYMNSFYNKYKNCITMFEYTIPEDFNAIKYIKTYYGFNESGYQNRDLVKGMIDEFGECAIPDLIINADNKNSVSSLFNYLESTNPNARLSQLLVESANDVNCKNCKDSINRLKNKSDANVVAKMKERHASEYKESVIMSDHTKMIEYSESEIESLQNLISLREYQLASVTEGTEADHIYSEIMNLYEEFDGLISEDCADSIIPMLPRATGGGSIGINNDINESSWLANTTNKKTGEIPGYLKNNHDMNYGEDDNNHKPKSDLDDLESYRRPSSKSEDEDNSNDEVSLDNNNDYVINDDHDSKKEEDQKSINNYYYYTYTNSLNKNSNSFNKEYDNSTNKGNNRDNKIDNSSGDNRGNIINSSKDDDSIKECVKQFELDIFNMDEVFTEKTKIPKNIMKAKRHRFSVKPDEQVNMSIKLSKEEFESLDKYLNSLKNKIDKVLKKYQDKYSIYGFYTNLDDGWKDWIESDDGGAELDVRMISGKYTFDIELPYICGTDVYELFEVTLKNKYPEEYHKYANIEDRHDLAEVFWANKFLDYDKNLEEIISSIESDLKHEIPEIFEFDFWDDWDSIFYGYYLPAETIYPKFTKDAVTKIPSRISKLASNIKDTKFKHALFKSKGEVFKESYFLENVGDADADKPESDHPIRDTLIDIDKETTKYQQAAKKKVQEVQNVGRAFAKPAVRATQWIGNMLQKWKDADENNIKEKMADPHARKGIFNAIKSAIKYGSLFKAGLLLNPVFLFLTVTKKIGNKKNENRIRSEMISELKTELEVLDEKIEDANRAGDNQAKYKLIRFKNELHKKLLRVGGSPDYEKVKHIGMSKII